MAVSASLEVVVAGNIEGVRRAFRQLNSEMTGVQGRFTKTGGAFERATKKYSKGIAKNLIGSVGDLGASFLPAAGNLGVFSAALASVPFAGAILGAAGLTVALIGLRDRESGAEIQAKRLAAARAEVGKAEDAAAAAATGQAQAAVEILTADKQATDSAKALAAARKHLADVEAKHGADSAKYRDALLAVRQAELDSRNAALARDAASQKSIQTTVNTSRSIDEEISKLRNRKRELELSILATNTFGVAADTLAKRRRELGRVEDQLQSKLSTSAERHRENGRAASEMARSIDGTSKKAQELRGQLAKLAAQEFKKAAAIDMINDIAGAAANAAGQVAALIGAISGISSSGGATVAGAAKKVIGKIAGGGKKKPPGGRQRGQEFTRRGVVARNRPSITIADAVQATLTAGARDDSLQDKQARAGAEAAAVAAGEKNPDVIRLRGEQAVLKRRTAENQQRQRIVATGLRRVRAAIVKQIKRRDTLFAQLRKIPRTKKTEKARQAKLDAIQKVKQVLADLYGQERGLMDEAAELAAEAAELGFDAAQVESEIPATPATPAADVGGGTGTGLGGATAAEAQLALAGLTPGTADDLAASQAVLAEQQAALAAAQQRGDNDAIVQLAGSISSLMDSIAALQGAVDGNTAATQQQTEASAGSTTFQFHGQGYYVGQTSESLLDAGVGI